MSNDYKSRIDAVIEDADAQLLRGGQSCPVVITTRVRYARNLAGDPFPGWAKPEQRNDTFRRCVGALDQIPALSQAVAMTMGELTELEKTTLAESHLISRDLVSSRNHSGVVVMPECGGSIMINEEDHLRIQIMRKGTAFHELFDEINSLDDAMEERLDYAFSDSLGYLTSCPTNLGTAMRASAMMHLPGLVMKGHMEQVVRMVNQLGIAVRGFFGEGSQASGSIFQISNQQTLGEDEKSIIKRLGNVLGAVIEQEENARAWLMEEQAEEFMDKIGRARGVLQNGHLLSSQECMENLSMIRLAADMELVEETWRDTVDRLMIESQPAHVQRKAAQQLDSGARDILRATMMREEFENLPSLTKVESSAK